jgi:hypothetical protein
MAASGPRTHSSLFEQRRSGISQEDINRMGFSRKWLAINSQEIPFTLFVISGNGKRPASSVHGCPACAMRARISLL